MELVLIFSVSLSLLVPLLVTCINPFTLLVPSPVSFMAYKKSTSSIFANFSSSFRPIFAAYYAPTYKLSKYLVKIIAPLTINESTVENSYSSSKAISNFSNADSFYMVLIYVDSLFTNGSLSETISIILNHIFANKSSFLEMTRLIFKKLL